MIKEFIFNNRDEKYARFQRKLIPNLSPESIVGVRTPVLRKYAKELASEENVRLFLSSLPHNYFEENQLHAFVISLNRDFVKCISEVEAFLPYVDNWATCDQLSPKIFKMHREELLCHIKVWLKSQRTYTVRFGIKMLMEHYLDEAFKPEYLEMVSVVKSDEYYVNMMIAWYFATALAKQYDSVLSYIENQKLDKQTHNKAIQKALESRRISLEKKDYLRTLKIGKQK